VNGGLGGRCVTSRIADRNAPPPSAVNRLRCVMSRIGLAPSSSSGVDVLIDGPSVTVRGSKGSLSRMFSDRVSFSLDDGVVSVARRDDARESRALHGLSQALLHNMVVGVSQGFQKELQCVGVGYRASLQGTTLELLVGFSHPVKLEAPEGITFEVPAAMIVVGSQGLVGRCRRHRGCRPQP
jgi:large subunit ribosomal protein L6